MLIKTPVINIPRILMYPGYWCTPVINIPRISMCPDINIPRISMYTHDIDSHFSIPLLSDMMGTHEVEELDEVGRYLANEFSLKKATRHYQVSDKISCYGRDIEATSPIHHQGCEPIFDSYVPEQVRTIVGRYSASGSGLVAPNQQPYATLQSIYKTALWCDASRIAKHW